MDDAAIREEICHWGRLIFGRGLTPGSSGNLSAKLEDGYLVTPTNACLGTLEPERLSKLSPDGAHVSGDKPTKEVPLHLAFYDRRPDCGAVVHLHSTYATLLSCLDDVDPKDAVPAITPYVVMRVGRVPVLPYRRPGSPDMSDLVAERAGEHAAVLLANHGPVVSGKDFRSAVFAMEELEETAKLAVLSRGLNVRRLTESQVAELEATFRLR